MKTFLENTDSSAYQTKADTFIKCKTLNTNTATKDIKQLLFPKVIEHKSVITNFLTEIYSNIFIRSNRKFNNYIFQQIIRLPMVVSDKIYNYLNHYERTPITISQFSTGLYDLMYNDYLTKMKIVFKIYDFDNDNEINISDVLLILRSFHLIENKDKTLCYLEKLVCNFFYNIKSCSISQFMEKTQKINSDLCILLLIFINNYLNLLHKNELTLYKKLINYKEKNSKKNSYKFQQKIKIDVENLKLTSFFYDYINIIKLTEDLQYKPDPPIDEDELEKTDSNLSDDERAFIDLENFEKDKILMFQNQQKISLMLLGSKSCNTSIINGTENNRNNLGTSLSRFKLVKEKTYVDKAHEGIKTFLDKNNNNNNLNTQNNNNIQLINDNNNSLIDNNNNNIQIINANNNNNNNYSSNIGSIHHKPVSPNYLMYVQNTPQISSYKDYNTSSINSHSGISKRFNSYSKNNNNNNDEFHKRNKSSNVSFHHNNIPCNNNNILSVNPPHHRMAYSKSNTKQSQKSSLDNNSNEGSKILCRIPTFNTKNSKNNNFVDNPKNMFYKSRTLLTNNSNNEYNLDDGFNEYENKIILYKSKDELQTKTIIKLILVNSYIFYLKKIKHEFVFKKLIPIFELFPQKIKINKLKCQVLFQSTIHNYIYNYTFIGECMKEIDIFLSKIKERNDIEEISNDYEFGHQLGQGKFGHVILGRNLHDSSNKKYAIKIVKKESKTEEEFKINRWESYIFSMLMNVSHPNIVKCYKKYENLHNIFFVYEYIEGYDLKTFVKLNFDNYNQINVINICEQLIKGVYALHKLCIIHRDIKTTNIMINNQGIIKILDFGLSRILSINELSTDPYGSLCFKAPELISHKPYGFKVDVWAMGVTIYYIIFQALPFDRGDKSIIKQKILSEKININLPTCNSDFDSWLVLNIIQECLIKNDDMRMDIANLYNKFCCQLSNNNNYNNMNSNFNNNMNNNNNHLNINHSL